MAELSVGGREEEQIIKVNNNNNRGFHYEKCCNLNGGSVTINSMGAKLSHARKSATQTTNEHHPPS